MERLSFLDRPLPDGFRLRTTVVAPGAECPYRDDDWAGALVVVERGEIDLECRDGSRVRFVAGDVLWLAALPLTALRNRGEETALLAAVTRG